MGGFTFRLEHEDGTPAEPRKFDAAVPNWRPGDTIHLGPAKMLRVVAIRDDDADQPPRLVVEDMSGPPLATEPPSSDPQAGRREFDRG